MVLKNINRFSENPQKSPGGFPGLLFIQRILLCQDAVWH